MGHRNCELIKFGRPSTMHTLTVDTIRMCRDQALTVFVAGLEYVDGKPVSSMTQLEIRVLPDGTIELFHDTNATVVTRPFTEYYHPTYEEFETDRDSDQ